MRSALPLGPTGMPAGETRASSGQGAPVPQERMRLGGRGAVASPLWPPHPFHRPGQRPLHDLLSKMCDKTLPGLGIYIRRLGWGR